MGDHTGQQLGNYRLIRLIGQGGFAEVYLGQHIYLSTYAAIKVLHAQVAQSSEMEAFLSEARTIAQLDHPNIIRVLEFGIQDGIPFLVMTYAPNGNLSRHYAQSAPLLPLPTILSNVKQATSALQYAHERKIIHRDVKPENMLLGPRNEVLLSDFGIALIAQSTRSREAHEVMGTIHYMAPEQLLGKPRPASDQYALGVIVYQWLCGQRPFSGTFTEVATQHMFKPPPPLRDKNPQISPHTEQVVMTALAKDPQQRFASIQAFATALEQSFALTDYFIVPGKTPSRQSQVIVSSSEQSLVSPATPPVPPSEQFPVLPATLPLSNTSFHVKRLSGT
jgi:serine/threonine protein kinase